MSIRVGIRIAFSTVGISGINYNATSDPEHAVSTVIEGPDPHELDFTQHLCNLDN